MIISRDSIKSISSKITSISDDVADYLARDVEYRLRQVVQSAMKFQSRSKASTMSSMHIKQALTVLGVEAIHGYNAQSGIELTKVETPPMSSLFIPNDSICDLREEIDKQLPVIPLHPNISLHWLAINGVQPQCKQNPPSLEYEEKRKRKELSGQSEQREAKRMKVVDEVKHTLSKELKLYYQRITDSVFIRNSNIRVAALKSLARDQGLHQLVPYLSQFVAHTVSRQIKQKRRKNKNLLDILFAVMRIVSCLVNNPYLSIELYLDQLIVPVISCLVNIKVCDSPSEDHWALRDYCARLMASMVQKYENKYPALIHRIVLSLESKFNPTTLQPLNSHYGIIAGFTALGVTKSKLLPHLSVGMETLKSILLQTEDNRHMTASKYAALKVYDALMFVLGLHISRPSHDRRGTSYMRSTTRTAQDVTRKVDDSKINCDASGKLSISYPIIPDLADGRSNTQPASGTSASSVATPVTDEVLSYLTTRFQRMERDNDYTTDPNFIFRCSDSSF